MSATGEKEGEQGENMICNDRESGISFFVLPISLLMSEFDSGMSEGIAGDRLTASCRTYRVVLIRVERRGLHEDG